jgi:hypothetical protein
METGSYRLFDQKVIIRIRDRVCATPEELLSSELFRKFLKQCIGDLSRRRSKLLSVFRHDEITDDDIQLVTDTFQYLIRLPSDLVPRVLPGSEQFFQDRLLFKDFTEYLYNAWRSLQRLIVCDSEGDRFDKHPYRTFNSTVEALTHLVRSTYRNIQESITGDHPRIYRQVSAGAAIATIALTRNIPYPAGTYQKLNVISVIRQVLIYPPLIFNPPMNKRTGQFVRVYQNPLDLVDVNKADWLCYPTKVGPLLIMTYFSLNFFELGFSLCNLFEVADDDDIKRTPDAVYLFGAPEAVFQNYGPNQTIFYDDVERNILVGAIPDRKEFAYFGYLKKMILTLHNIKMMKRGRLPFHGAMVHLVLRDAGEFNVLIMGDTGAGKSETLEALRALGGDQLIDIVTIADDMGSLDIGSNGTVNAYGTETGAFVRLDDLQPGFAFGQIDRTIIMNASQTNARVVLPVTTFENIIRGYPVDFVLYANNYERVDSQHPTIERFDSAEQALDVFRAGTVMSKGTTTTTGVVQTYFANIFGPQQYQSEHEVLAEKYFKAIFNCNAFVGQMRTQLGIAGMEREGPEEAAKILLDTLANYHKPKP